MASERSGGCPSWPHELEPKLNRDPLSVVNRVCEWPAPTCRTCGATRCGVERARRSPSPSCPCELSPRTSSSWEVVTTATCACPHATQRTVEAGSVGIGRGTCAPPSTSVPSAPVLWPQASAQLPRSALVELFIWPLRAGRRPQRPAPCCPPGAASSVQHPAAPCGPGAPGRPAARAPCIATF